MDYIYKCFRKYKFKSLQKAYAYFDSKGKGIKHKDIKRYFDSIHTNKFVKKYNKSTMGIFFSTEPGAYQMDIYFGNESEHSHCDKQKFIGKKQPYLLCVEVNSRYAWIKRLKSKSVGDVLTAIKEFVYDCSPTSISCDEESAFRSIRVVDYLRDENISLNVSLDQLHTDLAIINRLSRTLNYMLEDFDDLATAVKIYNKTVHSSTGVTPKQMHNDEELEKDYIYKQLDALDKKKKLLLKDPINKGDNVRYILDKQLFKKNQHNRKLSTHYYKVEDVVSPFTYVIIARDGSIKQLPRYRLYKVNELKGLTFGETIEDSDGKFTVYDKIFAYYPKDNERNSEYEVQVISRDEYGKKHKSKRRIKCYMLREGNPTNPSALEREYFSDKLDKYTYDAEKGIFVAI